MPTMRTISRSLTCLAAAAAVLGAASAAQAQQKIKVAYLRANTLIPHWHAERAGFMKKHGLETEIVSLNNGPAVASAVASGSVDIGWSGSMPIVTARSQNQPFKVFANGFYEIHPSQWITYMVASEKSGIKTLADLKGRTFAMNAVGAVCELQLHEHLGKVGLKFSDVKTIVIPFPQFEAALELGNADAACPIEPFLTSMKLGGKIKPVILSTGTIADMDKLGPVSISAYFATESWLAKNAAVTTAFREAIEEAHADLMKKPKAWAEYLVEEFKMPPDRAAAVPAELTSASLAVKPEQWQPIIDAMNRHGMLKSPVKVDDILFTATK